MFLDNYSKLKPPKLKLTPKSYTSAWDFFDKPVKGSTEAKCRLCLKPTLIKCKNGGTTGLNKHLTGVHSMTKGIQSNDESDVDVVVVGDVDVVEEDNPGQNQSAKKQKMVHEPTQSTLESFVTVTTKKESIEQIIAEMVSKDGFTFRQIEGSRWVQKLLKQCGYEPPKAHSTIKNYATNEANRIRSTITKKISELKAQNKKFSTSVDEQTTAANFRIINVQLYYEGASFNLGMIRIHRSCSAIRMIEVIYCHETMTKVIN